MKLIRTIFLFYGLITAQSNDLLKKATSVTGMSESQLRSIARKKGLSNADIELEAQKRGFINDEFQKSSEQDKTNEDSSFLLNDKTDDIPNNNQDQNYSDDEIQIKLSDSQDSKKEFNYFGYEIFNGDPSVFQASNFGLIDPEYNIGPGDEIIIMLWGETQFIEKLTVGSEGYIFIPNIGQVFVNSLNLEKLEKKLFNVLSKVYSSLNPMSGSPTTFIDISLGQLRPLRIMVLGEVSQPGAYSVNPNTSLITSLYYFNGPTIEGSLREIHLIRNGKKIANVDFYNYLLTGEMKGDTRLQIDDIIFIPKRGKTVTIIGEIKEEAVYEIKEGELLSDLVRISGGLKSTAYLDRAQVDRIIPFSERNEKMDNRVIQDINLSSVINKSNDYELKDGDKIEIFSIFDLRQNDVYIKGDPVLRPGRYELIDNMKVSDLVKKSGGITSNAFLKKAILIRVNPENQRKEFLSINLKGALENNSEHNLSLLWMDELRIFSNSEMLSDYTVSLKGHVKYPGNYNLFENKKINDLLFLYGGLLDGERLKETYLERADLYRYDENKVNKSLIKFNLDSVLFNPYSKQNLKLLPGDEIFIYSKEIFDTKKNVKIIGEVNYEGEFPLTNNMTIEDLILKAGGIKNNLTNYNIEVARTKYEEKNLENLSTITTFRKNEKFIINPNGMRMTASQETLTSFKLQKNDLIIIRNPNLFDQHSIVHLSGMVKSPGDYVLQNVNESISDIISRAGGLRQEANLESSIFKRNGVNVKISISEAIRSKKSQLNYSLKNGDSLYIGAKNNIVFIYGEVNNPGARKFVKGKDANYYIKTSGGLTQNADKENIWVVYPNGDSKKIPKWLGFPIKIYDGSTINISKKEKEEPFDKTEFFKEVASIVGDFAQVITLIALSLRN